MPEETPLPIQKINKILSEKVRLQLGALIMKNLELSAELESIRAELNALKTNSKK